MKTRGTLAAILAITGMMAAAEMMAGRMTAVARADAMGAEAGGSDSIDSSPSLREMISTLKKTQAAPVSAQSNGKRTPAAKSSSAAKADATTKAASTRKPRPATKSDSAVKSDSAAKATSGAKPGPAAKSAATAKSRSAESRAKSTEGNSTEKKSTAKKPAADAPAKASKKASVAKTSRKAA